MDYSYYSNAELEGKMTSQRCSESWNPQSSLRPVPSLPSKDLPLGLGQNSAHQVRVRLPSAPQASALQDEHPWCMH